jgi:hypothetical protein
LGIRIGLMKRVYATSGLPTVGPVNKSRSKPVLISLEFWLLRTIYSNCIEGILRSFISEPCHDRLDPRWPHVVHDLLRDLISAETDVFVKANTDQVDAIRSAKLGLLAIPFDYLLECLFSIEGVQRLECCWPMYSMTPACGM